MGFLPKIIHEKVRIVPFISIAFLLLGFLAALGFLSNIGHNMTKQQSPLVDASMEVKLNAAMYHLWLEELIQGDSSINAQDVWSYLDASEWYAKAMLFGGKNEEGTYIPLENPNLRKEINETLEKIAALRKAGNARLNNTNESGIGSQLDQAFDKSFNAMIEQADKVETELLSTIASDHKWYDFIAVTLIVSFSVIGIIILIGFVYFDNRRRSDLAKRLSLIQQVNQAQKMEALGTLVGGIAHDFNNTLAGITGNIYLAKISARDNPDTVQHLTSIENLSFRAASLIQQLLTFARKDIVNMKSFPLTPYIKETLKLVRTGIPENISLNSKLCSQPLLVYGDAAQIHQVLVNLISNAHDAVENVDEPFINIMLESYNVDDGFLARHPDSTAALYAHLSVEDNGHGIPEDQIKHLFEPFYTTKEQGKGTGLGLAMVFGSIKTHNGYVEVESNVDEGSTFHIYIPLTEEAVTLVEKQGKGIVKGHGETILLVDDEKHILSTGKQVLESLGYRVLEASDGIEAIDKFTAHKNVISLIIMDLVMPRLGGVKAMDQIHQIKPDSKVIYSTGYDKKAVLTKANSINPTVLTKPYNIDELSHAINKQLNA